MRFLRFMVFLAMEFGNGYSKCHTNCHVPLSPEVNDNFMDYQNSRFLAFNRTGKPVEHFFHGEVLTAIEDTDDHFEDGVYEDTWSDIRVDWITQVSSVMSPFPKDLTNGCRSDTSMYLRELRNFTEWAVRMMDASAKIPHGILMGNLRALGDFDECLWLKAPNGIVPQYCLASINLNVHKTHQSYSKLQGIIRTMTYDRVGKERSEVVLGSYPLQKSSKIEWAMCIPASCTASDVESLLNGAANRILTNSDVRVTVDPKDCYTDTPGPSFSPRDLVILSAMLVILLLSILGAVHDQLDSNNNKIGETRVLDKVLSAFSLKRNWNELTDFSAKPSGQIDCLDGMRAISSLWIVLGHQGFYAANLPYSDKITNFNTHKYSVMIPLWNFFLAVDTFLVIGGLVRAYTLIPNLERRRVNHWKNAILRYLRLTPALLATIGVYIAILDRISTGPSWSRHVGSNKMACELNWWKTVFYINNYFSSDNYMCLIQSWYTSMDMQYFLLSPLLIVPLWRTPRTGFAVLGAAAVIATIVQYATMIAYELPALPVSFQTPDPDVLSHLHGYYFTTHTRMMPYLIGIMMGYFMYQYKRVTISKIQLGIGWILSVAAFVWPLFGAMPLISADKDFDQAEHALYATTHKTVWAMSMSWLIFTCHYGYGGIINRILSCDIFKFLSRISYSVFLSHLIVVMCFAGYLRVPKHTDFPSVMKQIIGETTMAISPGLALYLFVEAPFGALSRLLFRGTTKNVKKVQ